MDSDKLVREADRLVYRLHAAAAVGGVDFGRKRRIGALIERAERRLTRRLAAADAERERRGGFYAEKPIRYEADGDVIWA